MGLIDREALVKEFEQKKLGEHSFVERMFADGVYAVIENFPTADAERVVYCKDCSYSRTISYGLGAVLMCDAKKHIGITFSVSENHFCSWGKRKDGD